jgi:hypothetical protein
MTRRLPDHLRKLKRRPDLLAEQILAWADECLERTGQWPHMTNEVIPGTEDETWRRVAYSLRRGSRGLPGGATLYQFLAEHRGVRNAVRPPPLTVGQILGWADAYHQANGTWPKMESGAIDQAPGETWHAADAALRVGCRGLAGGSSLAGLLAEQRGARNVQDLPRLTAKQILAWADAHHRATGEWPISTSGPVAQAPGETWGGVNAALDHGRRGLAGGSSLARLLARCRGVRNHRDLPRLTQEQILAWADAHFQRTGGWPTARSGPIPGAPYGETWRRVDSALICGARGLPERLSLARLLAWHRGVPNPKDMPRLRVAQILAWADAYRLRTGRWPHRLSGPVHGAPPGTTWLIVDTALHDGLRGWPGGTTLHRFLVERRGAGRRSGTTTPPSPQ